MNIAIVGLGYVGLPLAIQFARSNVHVVGLDIDRTKVDLINRGESYIKHIAGETIATQLEAKRLSASTDFARIGEVEAVIICVPTPLSKNREPDISYILETGRLIAPHLRRGTLVVLESTTYPGTTDGELRAVLEENAPLLEKAETLGGGEEGDGRSEMEDKGEKVKAETPLNSRPSAINSAASRRMRAGVDFHLAFSPEREDPGNPQSVVSTVPKVVGGLTPACLEKAMALYARAVETLVPVSSCRAAEATKLLENIFRSVNIALVNELKLVYAAMGIDVWEVIEAARTKPFGFMPFYPGPGLGGHCIPIDPFYLTWKAREFDTHTRFIELAGEINTSMPDYVIHRVGEALNAARKAVNGARVLVLGLAYKPNVDDDRESPSYRLLDKLKDRGATVEYHDPYVPVIRETREHSHWAGVRSIEWNEVNIRGFDLVLIATNHASVNYEELGQWAKCIVDTRNAMGNAAGVKGKVWKA